MNKGRAAFRNGDETGIRNLITKSDSQVFQPGASSDNRLYARIGKSARRKVHTWQAQGFQRATPVSVSFEHSDKLREVSRGQAFASVIKLASVKLQRLASRRLRFGQLAAIATTLASDML